MAGARVDVGWKARIFFAGSVTLAACSSVAPKTPESAPAGAGSSSAQGPEASAVAPPPAPLAPEEAPSASPSPERSGSADLGESSRGTEVPAPSDAEVSQPLPGGAQLEDGRLPQKNLALPRLSLRHVGMHIGGESNSAESKKPWLTALEKEQTAFLRCYRSVKEPMTGGTFGADLYVGLEGGAPIVKKTRHKLGGDEFDFCMRDVFSVVRFPRPQRATMLSYSLRFEIQR